MSLSFSDASFVVGFIAGIPPEKLGTLQSRLKQWQKMGFPEGTQVGKGRRAEYGATQIFQLILLVRLLRVGLSPDRAQKVIRAGWDRFKGGIMEAITCEANDADHLHYFMIQLDALSDLGSGGDTDHMHIFVDVFTDKEMLLAWDAPGEDWPEEELRQHAWSRWVTRNRMANTISIEIDSLLLFLWKALEPIEMGPEVFADEFAQWLHEARHHEGRFLARAAPTEAAEHFEQLQAQSILGRFNDIDHVGLARLALSKAREDDLHPQT